MQPSLLLQQAHTATEGAMEAAMSLWLRAIVPELILATAVTLLLPTGLFLPQKYRAISTWLALITLALAFAATLPLLDVTPHAVFDGTYAIDPFAVYFKLIILLATALVLLVTQSHFQGSAHEVNVPPLLLLTTLGMIMLAASQDLALILLFLTITTVGSYALSGIAKQDSLAAEGALKLYLFGAVAAAVMLYGMSLLYGLTGTLNLIELAQRLPSAARPTAVIAFTLVVVGYGFKVTLAPFHVWAPDTYQGAPTPIAAFLSVGPKAAGLAVLFRTLAVAAPGQLGGWPQGIAIAAAGTMTIGNLLALRQNNIKRLLAYSSIAQAGYLLMGIAAYQRDPLAMPALLAYLAVYVLMNLGAFLAVAVIGRAINSDDVHDYAGLARRMPVAALVLAITLLALAGIPPMASYVGKAMLFAAAIGAGYTWLAVIAAINTAISIAYYLRVIEFLYLRRSAQEFEVYASFRMPAPAFIAIGIAAAATLVLGVLPHPLLLFAEKTARLFGAP